MGEALKRGKGSERIATAEWGTGYNLWQLSTKDQGQSGKGIFVGSVPAKDPKKICPIFLETEKHALMCADTRSGKGRTSIIPTLVTWRGGIYANDLKGELAGITAESRGQGNKYALALQTPVHVFDPLFIADVPESYRAKFNPIDLLQEGDRTAISRARVIATSIVTPDPASPIHWDDRARNWITALCLYTAIAPHLEGKRNLGMVRELATEGDVYLEEKAKEEVAALNEQADELGEPRIKAPDGRQALTMEMAKMPQFGGELRRLAKDFAKIKDNERGSIDSTLNRNLTFLGDELVRDALSSSDFSLEDLRTKGASLYVCIPPNELENLKQLMRMMTNLVWDTFGRMGQLKSNEKQCLFVLDEFATMGKMPEIANQLASAASYGAKMWIIVQNLEQLEKLYGGYGRFVGGAGIMQFFEVDDAKTREFVSRQLGETEVERVEISTSSNKGGGSQWNEGSSSGEAMGLPGVTVDNYQGAFGHQFIDTGRTTGSSSGHGGSDNWGSGTSSRTNILKNRLLNPDEVGREFTASKMRAIVFTQAIAYIVKRHNYDETETFNMMWTPINDHRKPMTWDKQKEEMLATVTKERNQYRDNATHLEDQLLKAEQKLANAPKPALANRKTNGGYFDVYTGAEGWRTVRPWNPLEVLGWSINRPSSWFFMLPIAYLLLIIAWVALCSLILKDDRKMDIFERTDLNLGTAFEIWASHIDGVLTWIFSFLL